MNFLAHILLSGEEAEVMVGNFIGDFVKGRMTLEQYSPPVRKGIELHRAIDQFTDNHPVVSQSKQRLRPKYNHYAGIIVDVFYDHFLARNWSAYHSQPLSDFVDEVYRTLRQHHPILPEGALHMLPYMIANNWLLHYAEPEGIHRALSGMARRTRFRSGMENAVHDLTEHYDLFREEFESFFPELQRFCHHWLNPKHPG